MGINKKMKCFGLFLTGLALALCSGCESVDRDSTHVPWSRPASWEGQAPGMAGLGGGPGR